MEETKRISNILKIAGIIFIISLPACERTKYDLLDPETAGVWTLYNTSTGLPGNEIIDINLDSDKNLWVTFSGNGAASYSNGTWTYYKTSNSAILSNSVTALAPKTDGSMIIGTVNGISIRSSSGSWSSYIDPLATTMYINAVKVASNGWVWIGTENQGYYIDKGSGFQKVFSTTYRNVNVIQEDSQSNVWLGTDNGLLKWDGTTYTSISTSNGLPNNEVTAMFLDKKQRLWIGTNGGTTVSWIDDSGLKQLSLLNGNAGTYVRDIFEDRRGDIWFATEYDGLIQYNGVTSHSFKVYNGFFEDNVNTIGEDKYGNLWFGLKSNGLVKYTLPLE